MIEVAQEESSTPINTAAVVEAEIPATVPIVATPVAVAEPASAPETQRVISKPKRVLKEVAAEVKAVAGKAKVGITDEEHKKVLLMENEFLKITAQITQLQRQAELIQKNFPEYIKSLATKYSVDIVKYNFNAIEGTFNEL